MIVSHNELVATVTKAFLGMRRNCGEADIIANMVADLQMVGLNGVKHFNNGSRFMSKEEDCPVDVYELGNSSLEIDLHGSSLACHLPVVLDFALEKMVNHRQITLKLTRCHNRWLAYSELAKLSSKGIACKAYWENGSDPKKVLLVLNKGRISPELFFSEQASPESLIIHDMTIVLSIDDFDFSEVADGYNIHISAKQLSRTQKASWEKGIEVDEQEWQTLKETATEILVENSEQSRLGAGE
ncbi:DUF3726 domain-containing protein [Vibrio sp. vnigr-6D03]|uniref:DUF3726 domain-containing protein n=1 Tax=Vibrio penaeicida TaxID=104609 RepID=A0AAV5P258_9VIBR|nr:MULTISPECIES: DUF3726 domain-containing protein [Vibrio]MDP2571789.1 DUF3726 domain-containing protein [Vibrio penaeicida]PKF81534.1 DUF3726 domain-containing protein [Vibrio sp. vnigr-6D03]RTZ24170.1 DUF3726 domain-containing protein [Vibrio penaeicida]GLQ76429.1 hypothetical protein GCM10007932_57920 [Vibrio penaeicida]